MKTNFDYIINRRNTDCKRWDLIIKEYDDQDILALGIADMDFPTPVEVIEAIKKRLEHPCFGYTYPMDSLLETICDFLSLTYGWNIKKEWIVLCPDATVALYYLLLGISNRSLKRDVILQPPVFGPFFNDIQHAGYQPISNPLLFDNHEYTMDFDHLENILKLNPNIRALLLCNPQNPIGRVWNKEELEKLGHICLKNDCLIISDELHSDLILSGHTHTPIASINNELEKNTITSISPGKGFNIAGLKISALIIPDDTIRNEIMIASHGATPNILAMVSYQAALKASTAYYTKELSEYLTKNMEFLDQFLKEHIPALKLIKPQATFLAWVDMRNLKMTQEELHHFMVHKAKLAITYGYTFGQGGEGFGRFNIGLPKSLLEIALLRLKRAMQV